MAIGGHELGQKNVECGVFDPVSIDNWGCGLQAGQVDSNLRPARQTAIPCVIKRLPGRTYARLGRAHLGIPLALPVGGFAAALLVLGFHMDSIRAPGLRAALETTMTLFALAAAWLLRTQFASSRRLRDLLFLAAALVLGLTNLWTSTLPAALDMGAARYFSSAELWGQLAAGGILVAAALSPSDRLVMRSTQPVAVIGLLGLDALAVAGLGGLLQNLQGLPAMVDSRSSLAQSMARPLLLVIVLGAIAPLVYAAGALARQQREKADHAIAMLAAATLLLAAASLSELVTRSLAPGRIGADEALRLLAFSLILAAAVVLERRVRRRLTRSAALAERRRVASDLHDGLAQDLAVIAAHGPTIAREMGDDHPVVVAARRALAISRSTISELADPEGATAHESLEAVAQELSDRFDVTIAVDAQLEVDLEPGAREHVSRIAREAIANAARHGRAQTVVVSLTRAEQGIALRVVDDGCGIVRPDRDFAHEGFGLRSVRERTAALGGSMRVGPAQRGGTQLEVVFRERPAQAVDR